MTWSTKEWRYRPYAFAIGVAVANVQKANENLEKKEQISTLKFRTRLAKEMIYNRFNPGQEKVQTRAKRRKFAGCDQSCPITGRIIGIYVIAIPITGKGIPVLNINSYR